VIVARGGGSFEDLLPFSDEAVVRAFATSPVPVVSAVGHEQVTPLCDLAADVRASTPTAAARLVVPDLGELQSGLTRLRGLLDGSVRRALARDRERLDRDGARLRAAPLQLLERRRVALDHAAARLQALSPRATLARGYAVVRVGGAALRESTAVAPGTPLEIELATGSLGASVTEVRP
jgi:exodeoxyribonuclease VII large subunit